MDVDGLGHVVKRQFADDQAVQDSADLEMLRVVARALLRVLPESEIEIARFVWGNTNVALVLAARRALADLVEGGD